MLSYQLENVWECMETYNFSDISNVENEMLCLLCHKIMVNAHNGPCGCRYCLKCISNYLNEGNRICPGKTDDCKVESICLNKCIYVDHSMNIKISKLIVKCPDKSCEFKDELRKIETHIRICNFQIVSCPYLKIGCSKSNLSINNIIDHLQLDIQIHIKLLIDNIDKLNKEMEILKKSINVVNEKFANSNKISEEKIDKQKIMEKFENDLKMRNRDMIKLNRILKQMKNKFLKFEMKIKSFKCVNEDMKTLKISYKCLREDMDKMMLNEKSKQIEILEMQNKFDQQNKQMKLLDNKYKQIEKIFENFDEKTENENKILKEEIKELNNGFNGISSISNKIDGTILNIQNKLLELEKGHNKLRNREFIWKIDKIKNKIRDAKMGINIEIFSDAFYSHNYGYKLCLCIHPDGCNIGDGIYLSIAFHLMKGDYDEILEWPFKSEITFSLINQHTKKAHVSYIEKFANSSQGIGWIRPIKERNDVGQGTCTFIKLSELLNDQSLIKNDHIFIKCSVNCFSTS